MYTETFLIAAALYAAGFSIPLIWWSRDLRAVRTLSLSCTILASLLLGLVSVAVLVSGNVITFMIYRPLAEISFGFSIDRLSGFFLLVIAAVSAPVALYASEYYEHLEGGSRRNLLAGCTNLFILAMVLVVASADMLGFFFFWELMAAASFLLVMYEYDNPGTRKAGLFYFIMTQLSTMFVLFGIIALSFRAGSFRFSGVAVPADPVVLAAFLSLFLGFSIKAGIIPFHKWLPYAHPASPTPVSALMSGLMLKIAVYGLVRFLLDVFAPDLWWGILILLAGVISAVLGVIYALKEHDIKGMLAYSSIENIGIIFMGIGLFVIFSAESLPLLAGISLLAALFHSLNHALFKSLLFLTAGSVVHATHTRDIEHMGGLACHMPVTSALFFTGSVAIAALPPLNGFASELLLFIAIFTSITVVDPLLKVLFLVCLALFALTSALAAACFVKAFGSVFLALPRSPESAGAKEVPRMMLAGPVLLALACIVLGLGAYQLFVLAGISVPLPDMMLVGLLLAVMAALTWTALYFTASRAERISETWGCGVHLQEPSAEYTGHGFSEPLDIIFSSIYRTRIRNERVFFDQKNSIFREGTAEIRLMKVFEEYLYLPAARFSLASATRIARFQNGCLDTYLLYVFITVIAVMVFLGWS
ncbi:MULTISPECIES: proton-conducting transporter membrane subunit [unclassified Methanoregula]|uniref:proton-conducting transporter transmembrane domain-containing protein n=1 Tax=unclassified Methanoregula TaxID=2649730 RepID=UPI0009D43BD3|nr:MULTISPECIES: proton-conducting transporter membrane subunit [unclassified Methanoregula]OPX62952.1 MAG: F(420)H(2) dehydrogenase subunit L [Methanoregula sp. PtaB.Bin085]OPY35165.1 MAG: F(420)H(2) dehydrogenase subunit L [Methanoregula sp. PtaU1.Bin006]